MNIAAVKELIKTNDILQLERAVIAFYIFKNNLDVTKSALFNEYFKGYQEEYDLQQKIGSLEIENFNDLEHLLELLIPQNDRKLNGAFFTPEFIVDYIITEVAPKKNEQCIDPSCGCGAFLLGLLRYYLKEKDRTIRQILKSNIFGSDILDYNIRRTKLLIAIFGIERNEFVIESDFNLSVTNSLSNQWNQTFDVVVGNPPYVKFQDLDDKNRRFLKENFATIEKGTYNIYFAFFELGYKLLSKSGRLGYITPNNYFTSLAGESLREFFMSTKCISKVIDFNHTLIFDAQTYTCITFLNKLKNEIIEFDKLYSEEPKKFLKNKKKSAVKLIDLNKKKWRLLRNSEQENIRKIETAGIKLTELFIINVGIATLKDSLYFITGKSDKDWYYKELEGNVFRIEKELVKSIYKISKFANQEECNNNNQKIIFPYSIINGKAVVIEEEVLSKKYPEGYNYLLHIKNELDSRGKDAVSPFYIYGRSQGLNKFGIRLLTPTFSQQPKFLIVDEVDSLYCNGYGLHFKEDFKSTSELFGSLPIQQKNNVDVLQKILNSEIMHYYVTHTSVSIQGGYPCYQKNFIERFTIPNLDEDEIKLIRTLNPGEVDSFLTKKYQLK